MRTTLSLDPDILEAAKAIAEARGETVGQAISRLVRERLAAGYSADMRNGVPLLPVKPGAPMVTPELVRELLDDA